MQFGRVEGFLTLTPADELQITVVLDTRQRVEVVRDSPVPAAFRQHGAAWLADQLVQETLGNELAEAGWEVVGEAAIEEPEAGAAHMVARSTCYIVRKV